MADRKLFREPDERTGPAVLDREPMILPKERKQIVRELRWRLNQ